MRPDGRLYGDVELEAARRGSLARARDRAATERSAEQRAAWAAWADWLECRRWVADADGSPIVVRVEEGIRLNPRS